MSFGSVPGQNREVYAPSFERGDENLQSRENLKVLGEGVEKKESSRDNIENTGNLEKLFEEAKEVIEKDLEKGANVTVKASDLIKRFYKIAGVDAPEIMEQISKDLEQLFTNYIETVRAAYIRLEIELKEAKKEALEERLSASSQEEATKIEKEVSEGISKLEESGSQIVELIEGVKARLRWIFAQYKVTSMD